MVQFTLGSFKYERSVTISRPCIASVGCEDSVKQRHGPDSAHALIGHRLQFDIHVQPKSKFSSEMAHSL